MGVNGSTMQIGHTHRVTIELGSLVCTSLCGQVNDPTLRAVLALSESVTLALNRELSDDSDTVCNTSAITRMTSHAQGRSPGGSMVSMSNSSASVASCNFFL